MRLIHKIIRKLRILAGFFITRTLVVERNPDGTPKKVVRYRGEERFLREK